VSVLRRSQGFYDTMDAGFVDEDGFLYIMSRSDDVINVAGHRLSAGALEEVSVATATIKMTFLEREANPNIAVIYLLFSIGSVYNLIIII